MSMSPGHVSSTPLGLCLFIIVIQGNLPISDKYSGARNRGRTNCMSCCRNMAPPSCPPSRPTSCPPFSPNDSCVVNCPTLRGIRNRSGPVNCVSRNSTNQDNTTYCLNNCVPTSVNCSEMSICEEVCNFPLSNATSNSTYIFDLVKRFNSTIVGEIRSYCARNIQTKCSKVKSFEKSCKNIRGRCEGLCLRQSVFGFFADGCPRETYDFCGDYLGKLLSSSNISKENFTSFVYALRGFVRDVLPSLLVNRLSQLFSAFVHLNSDIFTNMTNINNLFSLFDELFDNSVRSNWMSDDVMGAKSAVFQLETLGRTVGQKFRKKFFSNFKGNNLLFSAKPPNRRRALNNKHKVTLQAAKGVDAEVKIPLDVLCDQNETEECSSVVTVALVDNLAVYLHRALIRNQTRNGNINFTEYIVATELVSVQVLGVGNSIEGLTGPMAEITMTISVNNLTKKQVESSLCVFWNHTESSWSDSGVTTQVINNTAIRCLSEHLTSFAVLVSLNPNPTSSVALSVLSYIGCSVSIVCLLATIVCLVLFRKIFNKGPLLYIHLNLSIALLLGYLFFVVGVETAVNIPGLCITLAALMQYFFLASFCWMLCEGIMLYLLVVRVFGTAAQRWYWLLIPGWGVPLPVVVISAAVLQEKYISQSYCWLDSNPTGAAIWTFIAPMLLVILINTVILVLTVVSIVRGRKKGGAETKVNTRTLAITALKGTIVLLPLLGITWVVGLFAVNRNTEVFAWIFVFLNSFQGLYIFVIHVLRNKAFLKRVKQICSSKVTQKRTEMSSIETFGNKHGSNKTLSVDYDTKFYSADLISKPTTDRSLPVKVEIEN